MAVKRTIEDMQRLAASRGGFCLSQAYVRRRVHLEWQCAEGHRWRATPAAIIQRTWCPFCARARMYDTLETMQEIAAKRGGRCLSDTYSGTTSPLEWECAKGHRWSAVPRSIKRGRWCPECARLARAHSIEEMHEVAQQRGGQCLSTAYRNSATPLDWRCAQGHTWPATPNRVLQGDWCRQCATTTACAIRSNPCRKWRHRAADAASQNDMLTQPRIWSGSAKRATAGALYPTPLPPVHGALSVQSSEDVEVIVPEAGISPYESLAVLLREHIGIRRSWGNA